MYKRLEIIGDVLFVADLGVYKQLATKRKISNIFLVSLAALAATNRIF